MNIHGENTKRLYDEVSGFSLIELLAAMAVLAVVMAMLLQVVDGILACTRMQSQQMDSLGAARGALDTMALDLSGAVVGESSAVLVSSTSNNLALITDRRGANSTDHRYLAVIYSLAGSKLIRTYRSVSSSETDLLAAASNTNSVISSGTSTLGDGILSMSMRILTSSPSNSGLQSGTNTDTSNYATNTYNGFTVPSGWKALITTSPAFATTLSNRAQALEVWIAAVDPQNNILLQQTGARGIAQASLGSDPTVWRSEVDAANIPRPVKSSIQILNKTIPLP